MSGSSSSYIPYVIDHQVISKGKTLGASKKRIVFKFGFANERALADGLVGANCRGTEHEVVLIWSLNSGKRQILADGKEIHYSESGANGWTADRTFQHPFTLRSPGYGAFKCRLISVPAQPGIPPYDLTVGGVSIYQMCKIFQLGTNRNVARAVPLVSNHDPEVDPYASPEERRQIAQAKLESLRDFRRHGGGGGSNQPAALEAAPAPAREETSLISFDDDPAPLPAQTVGGSPGRGVSAITMDPALTQQQGGGQPYGAQGGVYPGQQQQQATSSALTPWQPAAGGAPPASGTAVTYGSSAPTFAQPPQPASVAGGASWGTAPAAPAYPGAASAAPSYAAAPAAPAYGSPAYGAPAYGAPPAAAPAPAAPSVAASMDPYGATPADPFATGAAPTTDPYAAPAPADPYTQAPAVATTDPYGAPPAAAPLPFTSPTSTGTYGSAPSFAQPPPAATTAAPPQPTYPQYTGY